MSSQLWDDDSAEGSLWSRSFDFDDSGIEGSSTMTTKTLSLLVEEVRIDWHLSFCSIEKIGDFGGLIFSSPQ